MSPRRSPLRRKLFKAVAGLDDDLNGESGEHSKKRHGKLHRNQKIMTNERTGRTISRERG